MNSFFAEYLNMHFLADSAEDLQERLRARARNDVAECAFLPALPENAAEESLFADDYERLFCGADPSAAVPLWESVYARKEMTSSVSMPSNTGRLLDACTASVAACYIKEGVWIKDTSQPADYIGCELAFCLLLRERYGEEGPAAAFADAHVRRLLRSIFRLAGQRCRSAYFAALSRLVLQETESGSSAAALPEADRQEILSARRAEGADEQPAKRPVGLTGQASAWFYEISEAEAEALLEQRQVRAAGRGNCGGKCAFSVRVQAGCILGTESGGEAGSVQASLRPCARGLAYPDTFLRPDRLRTPLLQTGERGSNNFRRISWKDAVLLTADKIRTITDRYGPGSRYVNYSTGVSAVIRGDRMAKRLLALDGGFLDFYNSYSTACIRTASSWFYGTEETGSSMDLLGQTEMLILWGFNPVVTWHDPDSRNLLLNLRKRGVPIVVIDPHRSETADAFAAQWIPIRPGTDAALAAAMSWVILEEGLEDRAFLEANCLGFDSAHMPAGYEKEESWEDYILGRRDHAAKTPAWASEVTGIPAETIRHLAIRYAAAKPAAILTGWGPQRHANGEQTSRAIMVLPCLTGNVGIPGGNTGGSIEIPQHAKPAMPMPENSYGRSIPSFLWTDAILRGTEMTEREDGVRGGRLDSNIRLLFNLAGNTLVNQHSDVNRTVRILQDRSKCEFIVDSDLFMTASARYADLILPGTSLLEGEHMAGPWELGNFLLYGNQSIPPLFDSRFEFEWLCELAEELGIGDLSEGCGSVREWNRLLYDRIRPEEPELPGFEEFSASGGWIYRKNRSFAAFRKQRESDGMIPYPTETGKIEIFSPGLARESLPDVPALPKYVPAFEGISDVKIREYPLQLIGWHTKRRCHSIHDNNVRMEKLEPHRLWIHPEDAAARGLADEEEAFIWNDRGRIRMRVRVSDRIMPGVVCIPQGAWYTPEESRHLQRMPPAEPDLNSKEVLTFFAGGDKTDIRGCVNVLTTARPTPLAKGNPQHSALVEVAKAVPGEKT